MQFSKINLLAAVLVAGLTSACGSIPVVDPQTLKPVSSLKRLYLPSTQTIVRQEIPGVSYFLPSGPYIPLGANENGIFYACASGIVFEDVRKVYAKDIRYSLYQGGIFLPNDPKVDAGIWNVMDANMSGDLDVSKEVAMQLSQRCKDVQASPNNISESSGSSSNIVVNVIPIGPGAEKVSLGNRIGTNIAASLVVNAILSIDKGSFMIPPVKPRGDRPLRDLIEFSSTERND